MSDRRAQLLAAAHRAPAEDAPRRVLADALLERGDPLGELMLAQLADPDRRDRAPEAALPWMLGPLTETLDRVELRRGLPARARLRPSAPLEREQLAAGAWATLEQLDLAGHPEQGALAGARLTAATRLTGLTPKHVPPGRLPTGVREVEVIEHDGGSVIEALEQTRDLIDWITSPELPEGLALVVPSADPPALLRQLRPVLRSDVRLRSLALQDAWRFELRWQGRSRLAIVSDASPWPISCVDAMTASLQADLDHLDGVLPQLEGLVARCYVELTSVLDLRHAIQTACDEHAPRLPLVWA